MTCATLLRRQETSFRRQMMKGLRSPEFPPALLTSPAASAHPQEENKSPNENKNPANTTVAEGTMAKLSLQTRLHSKLNEVGDEVTAVLYEPVRANDGR